MKRITAILAITTLTLTACSMSQEEMEALKAGYSKLNPETNQLTLEEFTLLYNSRMLKGQACSQLAEDVNSAKANAATAAAMSGFAAGLSAGKR